MASFVRFDASQTKLQNQTNQYAASTQSTSKSTANYQTSKQMSAQKGASTNPFYPVVTALDQRYRQSPTKQQKVDSSYPNHAYQESSEKKSIEHKIQISPKQIIARGSECNQYAAELFRSSEEGENYDAYNSAEDQEDGGDPTCGDSDFEPAVQSTRGRVFHNYQQKAGGEGSTALTYQEFHERNQLQPPTFDFDNDADILQTSYHDPIDQKLNSEHDIEKYGALGGPRNFDNSDAVYRLRAPKTGQFSTKTGEQNSSNLDRNHDIIPSQKVHSKVEAQYEAAYPEKDIFNRDKASSYDGYGTRGSNDSDSVKTQMDQQQAIRNKFAPKALPELISYQQTLRYNESDMQPNPAARDTETELIMKSQSQNSDTMRRFARNTGAYPPRQKYPDNTTTQTGYDDRRLKNQSSRNMSSNSSEESLILIDSQFRSQTYYDPFSSKTDIELNEMKKPSNQQKSSKNLETDYLKSSSMGSNSIRNAYKPTVPNQQKQDNWQDTDDAENEDSEQDARFKSTGVGFAPNQILAAQTRSVKLLREKQESRSSSAERSGQKNLQVSYYGDRSKYGKQSSVNERDRNLEQEWSTLSTRTGTTINATEFNSLAFMYPQKQQLTKDVWATQIKGAQAAPTSIPQSTTQKEKRKKKKESPPEPHFMLTGGLSNQMETRSFYRNSDTSKPQNASFNSSQVETSNSGGPKALRDWFGSLSVQDRVNSLTSTYQIFANSFIQGAQSFKIHSPLCLFSIKKDKSGEMDGVGVSVRRRQGQQNNDASETVFDRLDQQQNYHSGYSCYPDGTHVREFQTAIMKSTRITSNKQNMDTISVHSDLVKDSDAFFSMIANATDDKAFSEPVYFVTRNGSAGKPIIETPKWVKKESQHYLGIWIIAIWEEALWAHFNFAKQVNIGAGVRKNDLNSLFELRSDNLQSQEDLAKRWQELGDEGQKKIFDKLILEAKEKPPEKFFDVYSENERRNQSQYSPHLAHYQDNSDVYSIYSHSSQPRYGLYTYQEMPIRTNDHYRQDYGYDQSRIINSYQLMDQQGMHPSQAKFMMLFVNSQDTDLKEILDVSGYTSALDLIKFLSEYPLMEINQKGYVRRHHLCRQLHGLIQDDLRQSIQDQLMNDLLAIDSTNSNKNANNGGDADEKQRKKKKQEVRNKKKKNGQAQQPQPTPTYQKKKSTSKSPIRDAIESQVNQKEIKETEFAKKQPQQRQAPSQSTFKPFQKEVHNGVASTTTSDDQTNQTEQDRKQLFQKHFSPKTNIPKKESKKALTSETQSKKKPAERTAADQNFLLIQIKTLLRDIVDSVCQLEEERKDAEATLVEQQRGKSETKVKDRSPSVQVDESSADDSKILHDSDYQSDVQISTRFSQQPKLLDSAADANQKPAKQKRKRNFKKKTDTEPNYDQQPTDQIQQIAKDQTHKLGAGAQTAPKSKEQREIMNNFMRKLHGDHDDEPNKNLKTNQNGRPKAGSEVEKGWPRKQPHNSQQLNSQKSGQTSQKMEPTRQNQQQQKPKERRATDSHTQRPKVGTQGTLYNMDVPREPSEEISAINQPRVVLVAEGGNLSSEALFKAAPPMEPPALVCHKESHVGSQINSSTLSKKKMIETNTVQFFQIENQPGQSNYENQGGIFIQSQSEMPSLSPSPPAVDVVINVQEIPNPQRIINSSPQVQDSESLPSLNLPQTAQREKICLTQHFMQPQFNFGNHRDFGTNDVIFENNKNIYENSRVRKIDYTQTPQLAPNTHTIDQESSLNELQMPASWTTNIQNQADPWANQNSVAMSTNSVSFTPTNLLSPQMSVRSEDLNEEYPGQTTAVVEPHKLDSEFLNAQSMSPPLMKINSQMIPVSSNEINFYNSSIPYQQNHLQTRFEQPYIKQHYSSPFPHQNQDLSVTNKPGYKKNLAPFRQPQQFLQPPQKIGAVNRSPTNQASKQDILLHQYNHTDQTSANGKWANQRGGKANIERTNQSHPVEFQNNYYAPFEQQQAPQIRVNAPVFDPYSVHKYNQPADWNKSTFQQSDLVSQMQNQNYLTGPGPVHRQSQINQQPGGNEKEISLQQYEDAFYTQFDLNISETTKKFQKAIDRFDEERKYVLGILQTMANTAFPGSKPVLKVFGSLMTGLALETSDMDIAVTGLRIQDKQAMIDDLHALEDEILKWSIVKDLKAIDTASIPVIKATISMKAVCKEMQRQFTEKTDTELPIDITFDDTPQESQTVEPYTQNQDQPYYQPNNQSQNFSPPYVTDYNRSIGLNQSQMDPLTYQLKTMLSEQLGYNIGSADQMTGYGMEFGGSAPAKMHQGMVSCNVLKEYVRNYPCLREVALLLKRFLSVNNLNNAYLGGISSYSAVLLIVAYMNNFNLHKSPYLTPSRLLIGFLDFYSNCFDPKLYGVNTANGGSYYLLPHTNQHMFVIQDPVQPSNNTARNSFRTPEVLNHFRTAFYSLKNLISKEYQKNLETDKQQKAETESVSQAIESVISSQSVQAASSLKVEKNSDGSGARQKQAQHKKGGTQPQQEPMATKAPEQQHNLQQLSSSSPAKAFHATSQTAGHNIASFGSARFSIAQSFSSVNFVEIFLSPEILLESAEKQTQIMEPRSGFGPF